MKEQLGHCMSRAWPHLETHGRPLGDDPREGVQYSWPFSLWNRGVGVKELAEEMRRNSGAKGGFLFEEHEELLTCKVSKYKGWGWFLIPFPIWNVTRRQDRSLWHSGSICLGASLHISRYVHRTTYHRMLCAHVGMYMCMWNFWYDKPLMSW